MQLPNWSLLRWLSYYAKHFEIKWFFEYLRPWASKSSLGSLFKAANQRESLRLPSNLDSSLFNEKKKEWPACELFRSRYLFSPRAFFFFYGHSIFLILFRKCSLIWYGGLGMYNLNRTRYIAWTWDTTKLWKQRWQEIVIKRRSCKSTNAIASPRSIGS